MKAPVRRRGGPTIAVAVDIVRRARATRSWAVLVLTVLVAFALGALAFSQTVVPWLIYPAL